MAKMMCPKCDVPMKRTVSEKFALPPEKTALHTFERFVCQQCKGHCTKYDITVYWFIED